MIRGGVALVAVVGAMLTAMTAAAQNEEVKAAGQNDEVKAACLSAHEQGQIARKTSKFAEARANLQACAQEECPGLVRADCVGWLADLERAYPSVVYDATVDGRQDLDARGYADGVLATEHIDGKAIQMEPGRHVFRIEAAGFPPNEQVVVLPEGGQGRVVSAAFEHPKAQLPGPVSAARRPVPLAVWVAGGVAATAAISVAVFGGWALAAKSNLERTCQPFCSDHEMTTLRTAMGGADISLGLAVAAALAGGFLYYLRPEAEPQARTALSMAATPAGGMLSFQGRF